MLIVPVVVLPVTGSVTTIEPLLVLLGHKLTRDLSPYAERRGYVITWRNSVGARHLLSDLDSGRA
jgi:hypothetical protein